MYLLNEIKRLFRRVMKLYALGVKEIPIGYFSGTNEYLITNEEWYGEDEWLETYTHMPNYTSAINFLKSYGASLRQIKDDFVNFVINETAQILGKYGLKEERVINYLYGNYEEPDVKSWGKFGFQVYPNYSLKQLRRDYLEYLQEIFGDIQKEVEVYKRAKRLGEIIEKTKLNRLIAEYRNLGGSDSITIPTKLNHRGEVVGWKEFDIRNEKYFERVVICNSSSWLELGNCRCVNHDFIYDERRDLTDYDMKYLINYMKLKNEFKEKLKKLPKGTFKVEGGTLTITDENIIFEGINCENSVYVNEYGTCRCVSHEPYFRREIDIEEATKLLKSHF